MEALTPASLALMASRTPARELVLGWMMAVEPLPVLMASTPLSKVLPGAMPAELTLTACASWFTAMLYLPAAALLASRGAWICVTVLETLEEGS